MRAWKTALALAGGLVLVQYLFVYANTLQFNDFVQRAIQQFPAENQLRGTLLSRAQNYSLNISNDDISITKNGAVLRVAVDYTVPLNLIVYRPALRFHAAGSGLLHD